VAGATGCTAQALTHTSMSILRRMVSQRFIATSFTYIGWKDDSVVGENRKTPHALL
jgi:hypothetical protein